MSCSYCLGVGRNEVERLGQVKVNHVVERLFNFELTSHLAMDYGTGKDIELIACSSEAEEAVKVVEILKSCTTEAHCGAKAEFSRISGWAASAKPTQTAVDVDKDTIRSLEGKSVTFVGSDSLAARVDALLRIGANYCDYDEIISRWCCVQLR